MSKRERGLVNIKDETGFEIYRLVGLLALEAGHGGREAVSERMLLISYMLAAKHWPLKLFPRIRMQF